MTELTREKIEALCEKLSGNGLGIRAHVAGLMHEGVPYETCDICTEENGFHTLHPVGVSHEECA